MNTNPVVNFVIDAALLKRVDEYQHKMRFPSRATAIKFMISWALGQNPKPTAEELAACTWQRRALQQ